MAAGARARAPRRTRRPSHHPPPVLSAVPLPLASCSSPRVPGLTPFRRPPPVRVPEPGSGCGRLAKRARGREKCFRGNGPRVGVCKLASVPARAAAAAGLARGAWGLEGAPRGGGDGGRPRRAGFWNRPRASPREFNLETKTGRLFISSDKRQKSERDCGFLGHLFSFWRTLSSLRRQGSSIWQPN